MRLSSFIGTSVATVLLFCAIVYTSCKKETYTYINKCEGVVCENNGACIDGSCSCTLGYSGDNCEKKSIKPYIGKWRVSQKVTTSTNNSNVGTSKTYDMVISEDADGVTILRIHGFWGEPDAIIKGKIAHKIGTVEQGGMVVEGDVLASPSNFVFQRYQPIKNTTVQVVKGEGAINSIGTQLGGDFTVTYPDSALGVVEEVINFSAKYID